METLNDPRIQALAKRVTLHEDDVLTEAYPGKVPARTQVRTKSGQEYEELVVDSKGTFGAPLTREELDDKFRVQVVPVLGERRCAAALGMIRDIESSTDVAELLSLLSSG